MAASLEDAEDELNDQLGQDRALRSFEVELSEPKLAEGREIRREDFYEIVFAHYFQESAAGTLMFVTVETLKGKDHIWIRDVFAKGHWLRLREIITPRDRGTFLH